MEEININLDSVPHNNVNVDLNSMVIQRRD